MSNKKRINVVQYLRNIETGFTKNAYRSTIKLMSALVRQKDTTFRKCWSRSSRKPIIYDDGRLYFDNYNECFTLSGDHYLPHKLYTLKSKRKRIVDTLIFTSPVHKTPVPRHVFKPFFLALTDDNWLLRYDNLTGELLQELYLGSIKYRHVDWETQGESLVLQSRQGTSQSRVLQSIAIFSVYPIEFLGAFDVSKDVFGNDIRSANISEGLLIIGCGSSSQKQVRLYSLQDVMNSKNFRCNCKLNEVCDVLMSQESRGNTNLKVGIDGIPVNINLTETPSLLFQVDCSEEVVFFGGYPWHYIYSPAKEKGVFELRNLETNILVTNGRFQFENNSLEPDSLSFHCDDSGRLVYSSAHEITFYKLLNNNDPTEVTKLFILSMKPSLNPHLNFVQKDVPLELTPELYTPRRTHKRKNYRDDIDDRTILSDDFENELEVFSVLGIDREGHRNGKVIMYDNNTGTVIKEFDIGFRLHEECDYCLLMDVDSFIITVKDNNNWSVHVYRMTSIEAMDYANRKKRKINRRRAKVIEDDSDYE